VKDSGGASDVFIVDDTGQVYTAGDVGIGTSSPEAKLQIGTAAPPDIGTPWDLYTKNPSYGRIGLDTGRSDGNVGLEFLNQTVRKWFMGNLSDNFTIWNSTLNQIDMSIDPSGNFSILDLKGPHSGGSAYVCVDDNGELFTSEVGCP
jgi:hypothetical protein